MVKRPLIFITLIFNLLAARPSYNSLNIATDWTITLYKKFISPFQGKDICNFSPTCSQFSKQAINDYGFLPGLIMTSDRLLRCNPSALQYLDYYYSDLKDGKIFDPPEKHYILSQNRNYLISLNLDTVNQKKSSDSASVQNFADYLFKSNDFARAAAEYQRLYFQTTDDNIKRYAQLMLGESYLANNEFNRSLFFFSNFNDTGLFDFRKYGQARANFNMANYSQAREILFGIEDTDLTQKSQILIGWSYFKEHKFKSGATLFDTFSDDSLLKPLAKFDGKNLPRRSRLFSTFLSTILPGLGQTYSGRLGDGIYSFLTISTTGLVSYYYWQKDNSRIKFSIFAFLTGLFWAGNIYGANIAARDYNQYHTRHYLTKIDEILARIDLRPDYHFLLKE
jgi:putative membrane protein insertion efficiency factor